MNPLSKKNTKNISHMRTSFRIKCGRHRSASNWNNCHKMISHSHSDDPGCDEFFSTVPQKTACPHVFRCTSISNINRLHNNRKRATESQTPEKHTKKLQTTSKYCSTVSNSKKYQALTRNFTHKKHGSKPPIYSEAIEMDLFAGILR